MRSQPAASKRRTKSGTEGPRWAARVKAVTRAVAPIAVKSVRKKTGKKTADETQ